MSRLLWFVLGILFAIAVIVVGGYFFVTSGGVSMYTTAAPLPLEERVAHLAMHASFEKARDEKSPVPSNEESLVAGARVYMKACEGCHGLVDKSSPLVHAMFPHPPQLLNDEMVTDDPVGVTYSKVTNGIRLSGMPAFDKMLSPTERWQVSLLLAHADNVPRAAKQVLAAPQPR